MPSKDSCSTSTFESSNSQRPTPHVSGRTAFEPESRRIGRHSTWSGSGTDSWGSTGCREWAMLGGGLVGR